MPIEVCLVDDNEQMRESVAALLNSTPGLRCVGAYSTAEEAVQKIPMQPPDVVLMDINLPGMSGIECVSRLKWELPDLQILMLTLYERSDLIFNSLRAGANGYLLKHSLSSELVQAIQYIHAGGSPMSVSIARKIIDFFHGDELRPKANSVPSEWRKLTPREKQILDQLARGRSYREIGEALAISECTVRAHLHSIYRKLHVKSRAKAVAKLHARQRRAD
jgi:DNA-binding NarL/FixJ family response regulator